MTGGAGGGSSTPHLAPREREILERLATAESPKAIGRQLSLSIETVRWYTKRIYRALDVNSRAGAVRAALELGLVTMPGSPASTGGRLPSAPVRELVGRGDELGLLDELLDRSRLVTVVGMGGIGKTALATNALRRRFDRSGNTCEARLHDVSDEPTMVARIATALGAGLTDPDADPWDELAHQVAPARGLLLLDNLEQLAPFAAGLEQLLEAAEGLSLLATSRVPLALPSEVLLPLGALDYSSGETAGATELVVAELGRHRPAQEWDAGTRAAAAEIGRLLGGFPLAIVLAASWGDSLSVDEILRSLGRGSELLMAAGANDGDGGIDAVISASIGHRSPDQIAGLARLSVFASSFTADAAEVVAGCSTAMLAELGRASLVQRDEETVRFQLHPLVVSHARRLLEQSGAAADTRARHRSYFASLADDLLAALHGSTDDLDQPDALQAMARDGESILRAWNDAVAERDVDALERMAEPLMIWLLQANRLSELLRSLRAGLAAVGEPRSVPLLRFLYEYISWLAGTIDADSVRSLTVVAELGEGARPRDRSIGRLIAAYLAAAVLDRPADAETALEELGCEVEVLPDFWEVRRLLLVGILRSAAGEHETTLEAADAGIDLALGCGDYASAHAVLTTALFWSLCAGRPDQVPAYLRIGDHLLARLPDARTAQAVNYVGALLDVWDGDWSGVPDRVARARELGGMQNAFLRSFVSSLEALYAGLEGDPVAAARAHGEIDSGRVQRFLREPVIVAEWGVALAHAHVGRLDRAATHVETMRELETSSATSEHRLLGDVVAALRSDAAGDRVAARRRLAAVPWASTAAEQMYRQWAPLAKLW